MTNPYAPPRAIVQDIAAPMGQIVQADRGARLGASILDTFFVGLMVYVPFVITSIVLAGTGSLQETEVDTALGAGGFAALPGFSVWLWLTIRFLKRSGQSIGKKLVGIKVVRADGSAASVGRIIWLRNVLNWFFSIIPLYGLLDSLFIFGEARQCLHDKIADTIVINA